MKFQNAFERIPGRTFRKPQKEILQELQKKFLENFLKQLKGLLHEVLENISLEKQLNENQMTNLDKSQKEPLEEFLWDRTQNEFFKKFQFLVKFRKEFSQNIVEKFKMRHLFGSQNELYCTQVVDLIAYLSNTLQPSRKRENTPPFNAGCGKGCHTTLQICTVQFIFILKPRTLVHTLRSISSLDVDIVRVKKNDLQLLASIHSVRTVQKYRTSNGQAVMPSR